MIFVAARKKNASATMGRSLLQKYFWLAIGIIIFSVISFFLGGIAAIFPASFSIKLVILIGCLTVLVLSLFVSAGTKVPTVLLRRLLFTLVIVSTVWPSYLSYQGSVGPTINPTRLIYWALTGLWLFWFVGSSELRERLSSRIEMFRPFIVLLVIYLAWSLVCAVFSDRPIAALYYLVTLMFVPTLTFLVALSCLRDRQDVDFILMLMVIGALIVATIGILEGVNQANIFYDLVPSLFPQGDYGESFWAEQLIKDKSRDGNYRVMSTFTHPLTFGEYLALILPLSVYFGVFTSRPSLRFIGLITIPVIIVGLYISHTRSPILASGAELLFLVGFLGIQAMRQKISFVMATGGFFALVTLALAVIPLIGISLELVAGTNAGEAGSTLARIVMFERGGSLVFDQPLLGYGAGQAAVTLGYLPGIYILTIDSYYLSVALESGLPGLILFAIILGYPITKGWIGSVRFSGQDRVRIATITLALIGFAVIKSVLSLTENFDTAFLLIALLFISLDSNNEATFVALEESHSKRTFDARK
jgi:hypothetical protein